MTERHNSINCYITMANGIRLNAMFSTINMVKYVTYLILLMVVILFVVTTIASNVYDGIVDTYGEKLEIVENTQGVDKTLMCVMVKCKYLVTEQRGNVVTYENKQGILFETDKKISAVPKNYFNVFNDNWLTIVKYKKDIYFVDDGRYMELVIKMTLLVMLIAGIFYTITGGVVVYQIDKTDNIAKSVFKNKLESKLQRELAESMTHEMGMPIAAIESSISELFANLYPCKWTEDNICDFQNEYIGPETCRDCATFKPKRSVDIIAIEHYTQIKIMLSRLSAVIKLVADAKHIKYSNGTASFLTMIENTTAKINSFKVSKFRTIYVNRDLLNKYTVGKTITTGEMLIIFNTMINNSLEAKATELEFKAEQVQSGKINIYVRDNGRGIRDCFDNIVNDETIFQYGYSTKDEKGNQIVDKSRWKRLLFKIGINVTNRGTPRGVGLSVNKGVLAKTGGDISIVSTSACGTTFKITIPVMEKKHEH